MANNAEKFEAMKVVQECSMRFHKERNASRKALGTPKQIEAIDAAIKELRIELEKAIAVAKKLKVNKAQIDTAIQVGVEDAE